jgi:hypothetical protein
LEEYFKVDGKMWTEIKGSILKGTLNTEKGSKEVFDIIKKHIPKEKRAY